MINLWVCEQNMYQILFVCFRDKGSMGWVHYSRRRERRKTKVPTTGVDKC